MERREGRDDSLSLNLFNIAESRMRRRFLHCQSFRWVKVLQPRIRSLNLHQRFSKNRTAYAAFSRWSRPEVRDVHEEPHSKDSRRDISIKTWTE